jgi:hypothetical protein
MLNSLLKAIGFLTVMMGIMYGFYYLGNMTKEPYIFGLVAGMLIIGFLVLVEKLDK